MASESRRIRIEAAKQAYGTVMDMGRMLRIARLASGLTVGYISKCMGVSSIDEWTRYEHNKQPIPSYILIKLMIFGTEFWARNRESFEDTTDTPMAKEELNTNH